MSNFIDLKNVDGENKKIEEIFKKDFLTKDVLKNPLKFEKEIINKAIIDNDIINSLRTVIDPELGVNIFDLGLIYGFDVKDDVLTVEYTLTTVGCPLGNYIENKIIENLNIRGEFKDVITILTFSPHWSINHLPYETKLLLNML